MRLLFVFPAFRALYDLQASVGDFYIVFVKGFLDLLAELGTA